MQNSRCLFGLVIVLFLFNGFVCRLLFLFYRGFYLLSFCLSVIVLFLFYCFFLYAGCVRRIVAPACCDGFSALRIFPCKPWPVGLFSLLLFCFSYNVFFLFFYRLSVFRSPHISVQALLSLAPAPIFSTTVSRQLLLIDFSLFCFSFIVSLHISVQAWPGAG